MLHLDEEPSVKACRFICRSAVGFHSCSLRSARCFRKHSGPQIVAFTLQPEQKCVAHFFLRHTLHDLCFDLLVPGRTTPAFFNGVSTCVDDCVCALARFFLRTVGFGGVRTSAPKYFMMSSSVFSTVCSLVWLSRPTHICCHPASRKRARICFIFGLNFEFVFAPFGGDGIFDWYFDWPPPWPPAQTNYKGKYVCGN